jgi:hypothetical protein
LVNGNIGLREVEKTIKSHKDSTPDEQLRRLSRFHLENLGRFLPDAQEHLKAYLEELRRKLGMSAMGFHDARMQEIGLFLTNIADQDSSERLERLLAFQKEHSPELKANPPARMRLEDAINTIEAEFGFKPVASSP